MAHKPRFVPDGPSRQGALRPARRPLTSGLRWGKAGVPETREGAWREGRVEKARIWERGLGLLSLNRSDQKASTSNVISMQTVCPRCLKSTHDLNPMQTVCPRYRMISTPCKPYALAALRTRMISTPCKLHPIQRTPTAVTSMSAAGPCGAAAAAPIVRTVMHLPRSCRAR